MTSDDRNLFDLPSSSIEEVSDAARILRSFVSKVDNESSDIDNEKPLFNTQELEAARTRIPEDVDDHDGSVGDLIVQADYLSDHLEEGVDVSVASSTASMNEEIPRSFLDARLEALTQGQAEKDEGADLFFETVEPLDEEASAIMLTASQGHLAAVKLSVPADADDDDEIHSSPWSASDDEEESNSLSAPTTKSHQGDESPDSELESSTLSIHEPEDLTRTIPDLTPLHYTKPASVEPQEPELPEVPPPPSIEPELLSSEPDVPVNATPAKVDPLSNHVASLAFDLDSAFASFDGPLGSPVVNSAPPTTDDAKTTESPTYSLEGELLSDSSALDTGENAIEAFEVSAESFEIPEAQNMGYDPIVEATKGTPYSLDTQPFPSIPKPIPVEASSLLPEDEPPAVVVSDLGGDLDGDLGDGLLETPPPASVVPEDTQSETADDRKESTPDPVVSSAASIDIDSFITGALASSMDPDFVLSDSMAALDAVSKNQEQSHTPEPFISKENTAPSFLLSPSVESTPTAPERQTLSLRPVVEVRQEPIVPKTDHRDEVTNPVMPLPTPAQLSRESGSEHEATEKPEGVVALEAPVVAEPEPPAPVEEPPHKTVKEAISGIETAAISPKELENFDSMTDSFFSSPVREEMLSTAERDYHDLIRDQVEEGRRARNRLLVIIPLLVICAVGMFFAIDYVATKSDPKKGVVQNRTLVPARRVVKPVVVRKAVPRRAPVVAPKEVAKSDGAMTNVADAGTGVSAPDTTTVAMVKPPIRREEPLRPEVREPARPEVVPPRRAVVRRVVARRRAVVRRRRVVVRRRRVVVRRRRVVVRRRSKRNPKLAQKLFLRGTKQFFGGKASRASRTLRRAIKADPKNAAAHRVLVLVYIRLKKKRQAKRIWRKFKRLKPKSPFVGMLKKQINSL